MFQAASDVRWDNMASAFRVKPTLCLNMLITWWTRAKVLYCGDFTHQKPSSFNFTLKDPLEMSHIGEHSRLTASPYLIQLFFFIPHPLKIGIMSLLSEAHPLQFLCTARQPITSPRLRGHLAAVDRREQLSTGPCRGGVSQTPHPKHLWRLIHCSSGLRSPRTACNCHQDQYALG